MTVLSAHIPRSISAQADSLQLVVIGVPWVLPSTAAAAPGSQRTPAAYLNGFSKCVGSGGRGRTGSILELQSLERQTNKLGKCTPIYTHLFFWAGF